MRQQRFEDQYRPAWEAFERLLDRIEQGGARKAASGEKSDLTSLPRAYRDLCHHLAVAKDRRYSPGLVDYLHQLVLRGHHQLYRSERIWLGQVQRFFLVDFPRAVRREAGLFWLSALLLYGPSLLFGLLVYQDHELIYSLVEQGQVASIEAMYDPENERFGTERQSETDFMMFGHYIQHNIGIGFRTFAGGILFGIGTVFSLVFNGLFFGAVSGHLSRLEYGETFWPFVCGHGAFELTGIVISGMVGLMLARALYAPGRLSRVEALRQSGGQAVKLVVGVIVLLVIAAFVEAFWSSSVTVDASVKYGVAAVLWMFVIGYFAFMGRTDGPR